VKRNHQPTNRGFEHPKRKMVVATNRFDCEAVNVCHHIETREERRQQRPQRSYIKINRRFKRCRSQEAEI
jgi:hypothetical protein